MTEPTIEELLAWLKGVENALEGVNMMLPKVRKIHEKRDMKMLSTLRRLIINQPNVEKLAEEVDSLLGDVEDANRRGYGFVNYTEFRHALAAFRAGEKA